MKDFSITMALVDFIPVGLFAEGKNGFGFDSVFGFDRIC